MGRKKLKREGLCHEAFRVWCKSEEGRAYIQQLMNVRNYSPEWITEQMREAYLWEADPGKPDRWEFPAFFRNWCKNAKKFQIDAEQKAKLMSTEREANLKEKHRSTGTRTSSFAEVRDRRGVIQKREIKKMGDL